MKTRSLFLAVVPLVAMVLMLTQRLEAAPEVTVYDGPSVSSPLLAGGILDFGSVVINKPISRTITVKNTGTVLITSLSAALEGVDVSLFSFSQPKVRRLAVGASSTLTVTVKAISAASSTATLHLTTPEVLTVLTDVGLQAVSTEVGEAPVDAAVAMAGTQITQPLIYDLTQPGGAHGI